MPRTVVSICLAALAPLVFGLPGAAHAETKVYYIPAEFPDVCAEVLNASAGYDCPAGVSRHAGGFCDAGLEGLQAALHALNLGNCAAGFTASELPGFDIIFLVDDRSLNATLAQLFGVAVADSDGRRTIFPVRTREGRQPRALVIGEARYQAASPEAWTHTVRDAAGWAHLDLPQGIPHGTGVFVDANCQNLGSAERMADRARFARLSWIALPAGCSVLQLQGYASALRNVDEGMQLFVWQYNRLEDIDGQVRRMVERARAVGADGIILDAEKEYRGHTNEAAQLMAAARRFADPLDMTIGFTTIGWYANDLPQAEFRDADYGMPQIYDRFDNQDAGYPARVLRRWADLYSVVIPLSGAHHLNCEAAAGCEPQSRAKTVREMTDLISRTDIPHGAIGWWSYISLEHPQATADDRWGVIRDTRP